MSEPIDVSQLSTEEVMSLQQKLYDEARKRRLDLETMQQHAEENEAKTFKQSAEFQELESHISSVEQEFKNLRALYPDGIVVHLTLPLTITYRIESELGEGVSLKEALGDGHYPEDAIAVFMESKLSDNHGLGKEGAMVVEAGLDYLFEDGDPDVDLMKNSSCYAQVKSFVDSIRKLSDRHETIQKAIKYKAI